MRYDKVKMQGKIWLQRVADKDTTKHKSVVDEGRLIYSLADEKIYYGGSTDWIKIVDSQDIISSGTRMLISNMPLPLSWNIVNENDDVAVLITDTGTEVGDAGGSWIITSLVGTAGVHDHGGSTGQATNQIARVGDSDKSGDVQLYTHRHNIQADGIHTHTFYGTWRPKYVELCEAQYE